MSRTIKLPDEAIINTPNGTIKIKLFKMLNAKGFSASYFADIIGKSRQMVYAWGKGLLSPTIETIALWCEALNCLPSDVVEFDTSLLKSPKK